MYLSRVCEDSFEGRGLSDIFYGSAEMNKRLRCRLVFLGQKLYSQSGSSIIVTTLKDFFLLSPLTQY